MEPMTTCCYKQEDLIDQNGRLLPSVRSYSPFERGFWRNNPEILLASVTLISLVIGWIGGPVSGLLPGWGIAVFALTAYAAGGYSGFKTALADAKQGSFNI
ncbi:MAG: hypothetical protein OXC27_19010, partial [Caldilineaceae bacterium]|nr:hypothetical protein [Caldilineaceae bacterium]